MYSQNESFLDNQFKQLDQELRLKKYSNLQEALKKISPQILSDYVCHLDEDDQSKVFSLIEISKAVDVFDILPLNIQQNILSSVPYSKAAFFLSELSPDDRTTYLQELPDHVVKEIVQALPAEDRQLTLTLLSYPEGSIGRLMTPDYLSIKPDWTVEKVLDHILKYGHDSETISLIYVIDDHGKLLDDIRLRDFLFVSRHLKVENLMDGQFIALSVDSNEEVAINTFRRTDRNALPVIDKDGLLLGIVTIDDILRLSDEEATEDIQKMGGQEALDDPYLQTPFFELMQKRAGWLIILFIGELFTATALSYFEAEISKAVVLALFLPLIISSGGNAGSQASTLIIRAMALGEVKLKDFWKVFRRELASGIFLGTILGVIGFLRIALWSTFIPTYGEHWFLIGVTIFLSLIGVVLWGGLSGAVLPMLLRSFKLDPATSSAPLVATLVDVTGLVIYFGIALYVLSGTLL